MERNTFSTFNEYFVFRFSRKGFLKAHISITIFIEGLLGWISKNCSEAMRSLNDYSLRISLWGLLAARRWMFTCMCMKYAVLYCMWNYSAAALISYTYNSSPCSEEWVTSRRRISGESNRSAYSSLDWNIVTQKVVF